jgi:hypothetical protein
VTEPQHPAGGPPGRPVDVDTGFWLWLTALPFMLIGNVIDTVTHPMARASAFAYAFTGLFLLIVAVLVVTFAVLLRQGYRWARTLLTAGGLTAVVYALTSLFTVDRVAGAAVGYAVCSIIGSVLIVGGVFLLHRRDSHAYFTR